MKSAILRKDDAVPPAKKSSKPVSKKSSVADNKRELRPKCKNPIPSRVNARKAVSQKSISSQADTGIQGIGGLSPEEITKTFKKAVRESVESKQKKGLPIARYDIQSDRAYLENADGSREYV